MTDYSKMTDEQVNEAIFRAKGWVYLPPPAVPAWQRPTKNNVDSRFWYFSFPPDYTHDWKLAGELLEEMKGREVSLEYCLDPLEKWYCELLVTNTMVEAYPADTPQRAICEAWLAWKELS